jgi:outer membrane protein assembly factor BamB
MAGRGRVFISHSQEDAARCAPLLAALDAWGVEYIFEAPRKGVELHLSERTQMAISECPIFLRICTNAIRRSYWMSLEAGAFLGLQAEDHRQGRSDARALVNLILDRDYTFEPFDRAGVLIDATKEPVGVWVNRLREALGLAPLPDTTGLGLERMLTASGVARRRLITGGLAVGVLAVAGGVVAVTTSGVLKLPKGFVESTPTATALVRSSVKPLWSVGLGQIVQATLAIADGVVFAGAWDGNLYALDGRNQGKKLWSFTVASNGQIYAPPVVAGGLVYTHGHAEGNLGDNPLYALRMTDGAVVWTTKAAPPKLTPPLLSFAAVLIQDGVIYIPSIGSAFESLLVGRGDAATGTPLHYDGPDGYAASSPTIAGALLYIGELAGYLYALDTTKNLASVWRTQIASGAAAGTPVAGVDTSDTSVNSSPAAANGVVYIGSPDHNLYAVNATTGKVLWKYETGDAINFSSPAVANGIVYIGSDDKSLHAVDAATGTGLWKYATGGKIKSSPAVDNGVVYVGSYDNNLYALDAMTGKLQQTYQTNGQIFASPRIVEGVLYFASYDNYVYAFKL